MLKMLRVQNKVLLDLNELKYYSKYLGANDSIALTPEGILNFSKQILIPAKVLQGMPAIFSGQFLKELLKSAEGLIEIKFRVEFGKLVAFFPTKDNFEITDYSSQFIPGALLEFPSREGTKLVSPSALQYLLSLTHYDLSFDEDFAYAFPWNKDVIFKFPNPFKGLKGSASGEAFKELKKLSGHLTWKKEGDFLYVFNKAIFFQKLEKFEKIEFPQLPEKGWVRINPVTLRKALSEIFQYHSDYKASLENGVLQIETRSYGETLTATVKYYGQAEVKELTLPPFFGSYLQPFENFPLIEVNFGKEYIFLRHQKLEAVILNTAN